MAEYVDKYTVKVNYDTDDFERFKKAKEDFYKRDSAKEKADQKIRVDDRKTYNAQELAELKNKLKQSEIEFRSAKARELEAERFGNASKIKEAIQYRKVIESELRLNEANHRLANSKELADYKAALKEKAAAERQFNAAIRNAPRTKLGGDVGSLGYVQGLTRMRDQAVPNSDQYNALDASVKKWTASLSASGIQVQSLSQKIGGEFRGALDASNKSIFTQIGAMQQQAGQFLKSTAGVLGFTYGLQQAVQLGRESVTAYGEQQDSLLQLQAVTGNNTELYKNLIAISTEAQGKFGIPDEITQSYFAFAVAQGRSEQQMQRNIKAAKIVSIIMGVDMPQAFKIVDATLEGNTKSLGKIESDFKGLSKAELENGGAVDLILAKYSQLGDSLENSASTNIKVATANIGEFKEGLGEAIVGAITPGIGAFNALGFAASDTGKILGTSLLGLQGAVNPAINALKKLATEYTGTNEKQDKIKKNLEDFKNKVPIFGHAVQWLGGMFIGLGNNMDFARSKSITLQDALQRNIQKYQEWLHQQGIGLARDPMNDPANQGTKDFSTPPSGSPKGGNTTTEQKQELNLIKLQQEELAKLKTQLEANIGDFGSELELKLKILKVEQEIFRLRYNQDITFGNLPEAKGLGSLADQETDLPGMIMRRGFKMKSSNANNIDRSNMTSEEYQKMIEEQQALERSRLDHAKNIYDYSLSMLENFGLMKGDVAEIVSFIKSIIGGITAGKGIFDSVMGLLGVAFAPATGGLSLAGGAALGGISGGMSPGINNLPRSSGGMRLAVTNIVKNAVPFGKAMEVETRVNDSRGGINV